ncbi:MAG: DNA polymerase subunit beta [Candidatus Aenigmatarchaeota archaeon]|nr:MAG: DNA polymerase subunit beta [Candidatus Aenigmarchaeota archaeon]
MKKTLGDLLLERKIENEKYFRNFLKYAKIAKRIAEKELKDVRVFIFGSIVKKEHTPASDIDLLIISKNMPKRISERAKIQAKILKKIGIFSPFEIHMVNEEEFKWYEKFIDKKIEVK